MKLPNKKALVDRYPRGSYALTTKLNAFMMCHDEKNAKKQFYESATEWLEHNWYN